LFHPQTIWHRTPLLHLASLMPGDHLQNGVLNRVVPITYKPYNFFLAPHSRNRVSALHNMPLVHNTVYSYMIRNDLTHTVLDFADLTNGNVLAIGWGWHGGSNQKWKLIQVGAPNLNTWRLQNQRDNPGRFLSRQANLHDRLVGMIADADATFVIQRIPGPSERYRILNDNDGQAVTLITGGPGEEVHDIAEADQVLDLHADGPPIALQPVENNNRAQIWSFLPVAQLPVEDGSYQIVNSQTGLVLDLTENNAGAPVHGLESEHEVDQTWFVAKVQNSDCYTFKNSRVADRFLAPPPGAPGNDAALSGRVGAEAARFNVRKIPGTQLYKIFFDSLVATNHRGLAVNLVNAAPNAAPGAVNLRTQTAQTWSFV